MPEHLIETPRFYSTASNILNQEYKNSNKHLTEYICCAVQFSIYVMRLYLIRSNLM